jgi:outer membrane protein assembly factor BamE (lipoprotein component of BamABCDE complex)
VILELVAVPGGDFALQLLDSLIAELDDLAGLETDHMVMVGTIGELEDGAGTFEVMAGYQTRLLELRQHAINRGETELFAAFEQHAVDAFGTEVPIFAGFEDFEDLQAWRCNLESGVPEILSFHGGVTLLVISFHPSMMKTGTPQSRPLLGLLAIACLALSACVYRINIQQGNLLEEETIDQVEIGMSKSAVEFLLGTPMVADSFHQGRWDYPYYLKVGRSRDIIRRWIIVYFEDDRVARIERDVILEPSS